MSTAAEAVTFAKMANNAKSTPTARAISATKQRFVNQKTVLPPLAAAPAISNVVEIHAVTMVIALHVTTIRKTAMKPIQTAAAAHAPHAESARFAAQIPIVPQGYAAHLVHVKTKPSRLSPIPAPMAKKMMASRMSTAVAAASNVEWISTAT